MHFIKELPNDVKVRIDDNGEEERRRPIRYGDAQIGNDDAGIADDTFPK